MDYELMHKTFLTAKLSMEEKSGTISAIRDVMNPDHLPLGTFRNGSVREQILDAWWGGRSIPATRSGIRHLLEKLELPCLGALAFHSMGVSLSDHYWIRPAGSGVEWKDINFFQNPFSEDLGDLLFGKAPWQGEIDLRSPDSTTDGILTKRWRIVDGRRKLFKTGTAPYFQEPFNEVIAHMISEA